VAWLLVPELVAAAAGVAAVVVAVGAPELAPCDGAVGACAIGVLVVAGGAETTVVAVTGGVEASTFTVGGAPPFAAVDVSTFKTPGTSTVGSAGASTSSAGVSTLRPITCGTSIEIADDALCVWIGSAGSSPLDVPAERPLLAELALAKAPAAVKTAMPAASAGLLSPCFVDRRML
jgi:hypothetical protein